MPRQGRAATERAYCPIRFDKIHEKGRDSETPESVLLKEGKMRGEGRAPSN